MDRLKESLGLLNEGIKRELNKIKKFQGEQFDKLVDLLDLPKDACLYYTSYNLIIIDEPLHDRMLAYLTQDNLIFSFVYPENNITIWCYQYAGDQLLEDYLEG